MANLSNYFENAIINQMRNNAGPQTDTYVALFTADTGLETDDPSAELTIGSGSYSRQSAGLIAPINGESDNASDINFPIATANWGTITHIALVDHQTNEDWGNDVHVLMWSPLDNSKTINTDDMFKINTGDLDVTIT